MSLSSKAIKIDGVKILENIPEFLPTYQLESKNKKNKKERIYQIRLPEEIIFLISSSKKKVRKKLSKVLSKQQMKSISWITCVK